MKKTTLRSGMLGMFLLGTSCYTAQAQYTSAVTNGSFEALTSPLCVTSGPYYLGSGWVTGWSAINAGTGGSLFPTNTGSVYDNSVTCTFGKFPTGYGPGGGHRSIEFYQYYEFGTFENDVQVNGSLTGALRGPGLTRPGTPPPSSEPYQVCIKLSGFPAGMSGLTVNNTVQVVLKSSGGTIGEKIAGEFIVPNTNAWGTYSNNFFISAAESGLYDKVQLRFKRNPIAGDYEAGVFADDITIFDTRTYISVICSIVPPLRKIPVAEDLSISIAPNPAMDNLNLNLGSETDLTDATAIIADVQGKMLRQLSIGQYNTAINVADFAPGIYFLQVHTSAGNRTLKFVKQ